MVALTAGAVACALAGDAGGCLQGRPPTGAFSHGFGVEGVTGPICWGLSERPRLFSIKYSQFIPSRTLVALCGWTLRRNASAMTLKTTLRNLMIVLVVMVSLGLFIIWFVWRVRFLTIRFCHDVTRNWMVIKEKLPLNYLNGKVWFLISFYVHTKGRQLFNGGLRFKITEIGRAHVWTPVT